MKKHYLLITLLLGTSVLCLAQTRYTSAVWQDVGFSCGSAAPIRNWTQRYSVSVEYDGTNSYLCLLDHSNFFTVPPVPVPPSPPAAPVCSVSRTPFPIPNDSPGFNIKDIYLVDDIAFFCGCYTDTVLHVTYPIWGYVNLNDFFTSTVTINYNILSGTDLYWLDRLVAYSSGSGYDIVAFSRSSSPCCKIIEIQDVLNSPTSYNNYDLASAPLGFQGCVQYIDDITVSDNHVIVSGHDMHTLFLDYIWYGIYKKGNISGTIGNTYNFPASERPTGSVICKNIKGTDFFALSYSYYDDDLGAWYTRIRTIDESNGDNVYSQQFVKDYKQDPLRMTYLKDLSSIELVQEEGNFSDFVQIDPFAVSGYNASVLTHNKYVFCNIDAVKGHHFITAYDDIFYLQDRTMNPPASTPSCPIDLTFKMEIIPNLLQTSYLTSPWNIFSNNYFRDPRMVSSSNMREKCFSLE